MFIFLGFSLIFQIGKLPILVLKKSHLPKTKITRVACKHTHSLSLSNFILYSLASLSLSLSLFTLHSSLSFPSLLFFFSSLLNGYQQRLNASSDDRQNWTIHCVHDPTIHSFPKAFSATCLRFTQEDRGSSAAAGAASAATVR